jgi:hypothetical protein
MSLTSARIRDGIDVWGMHQIDMRDFTGDASYPAGGYPIAGSNFGFGNKPLDGIVPIGGNAAAQSYRVFFDNVNKKLIVSAGGPFVYVYAESDIKGSANTDFVGAGGYTTLPTNGALLSTLAAADNLTAFTIAVNPDIGRNVGLVIKDATGGNVDGNASAYAIVGLFRGIAQTETISFTAPNLATMSNGNVAVKYGAKPFDSITSVTPTIAQPAGFQHALAIGSLIGLPQDPANNLEADIIKLTKNAADLSKTGLYSTTNKTVNFGVLADGDDISAEYNVNTGPISTGTNLSAVVWRLLGICRG